MNYSTMNSLWDISQAPSRFSQLPDDDFLALLQKQFATTDSPDHSASPLTAQDQRQSPNSDDSSPSPPGNTDAASRRHSVNARQNDTDDAPLKRKASADDMEPGPSSKNQHTADDSNLSKKSQPLRRRSTGNPLQDESRLLKRKEQNRAAQRAFRERKEKHVKDLEDQVAALEAKNEAAETENSNLRDLLSRLQEENLALKQAQFTFSVPKPAPMTASAPNSTAQSSSPFSFFGTPSPFPPASAPSQSPPKRADFGTDIDWGALTTFDPSMLSVLDEPTDVPMQTDTSPSPFGQYALPQSYKTIANNPLLMSFVDESPSTSFNTTSATNSLDQFAFNFSSGPNSWSSTAQSQPFTQHSGQNDFLHPNHSLDELFGGNFMGNQGPVDFNALVEGTSMSPVSHANGVKPSAAAQKPISAPPGSNSNNSSPSTSTSQSPFSWTLSQPGESPPSASESTPSSATAPVCQPIVLSRTDIAKHIVAEGPSPFTEQPKPPIRKTSDMSTGEIISCQGSNIPRTKESPENIEVLKAWRCITQNPHFKDADINELCSEFSKKARCDGTKVVLEPGSVQQLFEQFKILQQQITTQQTQSDRPSS